MLGRGGVISRCVGRGGVFFLYILALRGMGKHFHGCAKVLCYPMEAFEVKMTLSVFGGTQSIAYSLFKMWTWGLLSWKFMSSAPLTLFKSTWAYVSFLERVSPLWVVGTWEMLHKIVLSSGWCSCKANAHECVEEDFTTTFYRKKVSVSSTLLKIWGYFCRLD